MFRLLKTLIIPFFITCVVPFSLNGQSTFNLKFGSNGSGDGQFSQANGIGINPTNGNIYVADRNNERIQIFNSAGVYQAQFGTLGSGNGEFGSNNGAVAMAFDGSGNVWVVDRSNHRIQKFNSSGTYLDQFGSNGSGDGEFDQATGIAINPSTGNIYVADRNNERVQIFNSAGVYQSQFGSLGNGNGQFESNNGAVDLAIDPSGNVWVIDRGNQRIQKFSSAGVYLDQIGTNGSTGTGNGQFDQPNGIVINPSTGAIYVADRNNERVQIFNSAGVYQSQFGTLGNGDGQFASNNGAVDLAVDAGGNLWVVDRGNARIQQFIGASLPIELTYFKAHLKENMVVLEWQTQSEKDNDFFEIERLDPTSSWILVDRISGSRDSQELKKYQITDPVRSEGTYYYRLKQVDYDGSFSYSPIRQVDVHLSDKAFTIFPNPAQEIISVLGEFSAKDLLEIYDLNGRRKLGSINLLAEESRNLTIDISALPPGMYFLKVGNTLSRFYVERH